MNKEVCLVINIPKAKRNYAKDRKTIRKLCLKYKVTYITTLAGALTAVKGIESVEHFKKELLEYLSWYNEKRIKVKLKGLTPFTIQESVLKISLVKVFNNWGHFTRNFSVPFFIIYLLLRVLFSEFYECFYAFNNKNYGKHCHSSGE